jgi:hypothetical protein
MADLSHWDFAVDFSGFDAAALILGIEPKEACDEESRISPIYKRIADDYELSKLDCELSTEGAAPEHLRSVMLMLMEHSLEYRDELFAWMADARSQEENQKFSRKELARWLSVIGMTSVYEFDRAGAGATNDPVSESEIDPSDYPDELSAANIAFRAITNGYGNQSKPPRARLEDFLRERYPAFGPTRIDRIATVANPDKTTGRKSVK